ncbi:MAG: LysR family transcriptional regulator, partial [Myxococcota bacterium]
MSIEDRRLFLELTEAGSYAATARRLGLARSTVMRRVEALEAELGVSLVHRAGRALALTEAGHRLAEGLRTVFRSLRRVESEVRSAGGQAAGSLRLWGPMVGVSDELAECLATFQLAHPKVQLRLDLGRDPRAHRPGDFDVMLQMGHRSNPDLQVRNLFRDRLFLVASEAYLAKHGE